MHVDRRDLLLYDGADESAWSAPWGPEVYKDDCVLFKGIPELGEAVHWLA